MHYVAFSRVTAIQGLYIENINEKKNQLQLKYQNIYKMQQLQHY